MCEISHCLLLLDKIGEHTRSLEKIIDSDDIVLVMKLIDSRLLLLEELCSLVKKNHLNDLVIRTSAKELLLREQVMIMQVQAQKILVAELLGQVLSGSKAQLLYQKTSQE